MVNAYRGTIWVSIVSPDNWCGLSFPGAYPWGKAGWWKIEPSISKYIIGGDLKLAYHYYVNAHARDAGWGDSISTTVPFDRPFEDCLDTDFDEWTRVWFIDLYPVTKNFQLTLHA
ncbi:MULTISPECIES: DUF1036 domain-containing protein [Streptomyces]|uniref:DUF1036 domain-containing protein n=1 Tax=Streptomyces mutomycini TaxID=284036 RepID=A0ABW0B7Y4_9ACTN|nr:MULTISPECIES: DUF1036 domain-containing protein [Streptomyces]